MSSNNKATRRKQRKRYKERQKLKKSTDIRDRMCKRKVGFCDEVKAQLVAVDKAMKYGCDFKVYHCPMCGKWHLSKEKS